MKKQEDARPAVLREYDRWAKDHPNDAKKMGGFVFFGYLEKERPDLLNFRVRECRSKQTGRFPPPLSLKGTPSRRARYYNKCRRVGWLIQIKVAHLVPCLR